MANTISFHSGSEEFAKRQIKGFSPAEAAFVLAHLVAFWEGFAQHHRPSTVHIVKILAGKRLTRAQFGDLLASGTPRMSPSKARRIWDWLKRNLALTYPDVVDDDSDG